MNDLKRSTSRSQDTRKIRKILNEEVRLGVKANSDSETEDVDLSKELYPLCHFINDREEMIEQMFSIIKGPRLKNMLPPILKDVPTDELKADCLIHLLGMSKKRILSVMDGKEINSSSESESHSDSSLSPSKKSKLNSPLIVKQEGCSDISDNSEEVVLIDPDKDNDNSASNNVKKSKAVSKGLGHQTTHKVKKKNKEDKSRKRPNKTDLKKNEKTSNLHERSHSSSPENVEKTQQPKQGKTLLEILELEMRARAIRALLQKSGVPENEDVVLNQNKTDMIERESNSSKDTTPIKNHKKKKLKSKNDDVIVVAPEVPTIDLTDENDISITKSTTNKTFVQSDEIDNLINSVQNKTNDKLGKAIKNPETADSSEESSTLSENAPEKTNTNHDTEEIVYIPDSPEPIKSNSKILENADESKSSWAQRWLDSSNVKKVVYTSKICGTIRKRIKSAKLSKQNQESQNDTPVIVLETSQIQGSVDEYQSLPKSSRATIVSSELCRNSTSEEMTVLSTGDLEESAGSLPKEVLSQSGEQVQDVSSTKTEIQAEESLENKNSECVSGYSVNATETTVAQAKSKTENGTCVEENTLSKMEVTAVKTQPDLQEQSKRSSDPKATCDLLSANKIEPASECLETIPFGIIKDGDENKTLDKHLTEVHVQEIDVPKRTGSQITSIANIYTPLVGWISDGTDVVVNEGSSEGDSGHKIECFRTESLEVSSNTTYMSTPVNSRTTLASDSAELTYKSELVESPGCLLKLNPITRKGTTKLLNITELNVEPETLEIDITDEDREIE